MVNYCRVKGCHNRSDRETSVSFFRLPERTREKKTKEMSEERRRLWFAKLDQSFSGMNLKNVRVCSDHFISKTKADLYQKVHPDWVPTVNMDFADTFQLSRSHCQRNSQSVKFESLTMTLARLRLNLSVMHLGYQMHASVSTISRTITDVIDVMFIRMKPFVMWPEREELRKTMPMQFRKHFETNSWGGRTSNKHITENCWVLTKIIPGDLILADRGFDILSSEKKHLSPLNVETTRKIANVRIHVERVIGLARQKYTILNGTLPIDMLMTKDADNTPTIDKIAHVCCALVSLCESVVDFG
ncbi:LOW QUALITY PROTEIN: hypothetical protein MAR_018607 [Mya arenaria]|uniref:THAP-type domain-containing protein n=1 Tax=Mya arenaria TaxID=6604 RepID=A0ABY7EHY0_MYAAR|nr:LOW QUALITY PROTEIN: hypothetical protein MAR_018607 [Mya arenaria]